MADLYVLATARPGAAGNGTMFALGDVVEVLENNEGPGHGVTISRKYRVVRVPGPASDWVNMKSGDASAGGRKRIKGMDISKINDRAAIVHPHMGSCRSFDIDDMRAAIFDK